MQNPIYIEMFNAWRCGGSHGLGRNLYRRAAGHHRRSGNSRGGDRRQQNVRGYKIPLTNHTYSVIELIISKRAFDKLTPDQKKAVIEAGKVATAQQRATSAANEKALLCGS